MLSLSRFGRVGQDATMRGIVNPAGQAFCIADRSRQPTFTDKRVANLPQDAILPHNGNRVGVLAVLALALPLAAQTPPTRMEVVLEANAGGKAAAVDPGHVFESGDLLRFRFTPGFDGTLYVMERGTTGAFTLLFPKKETGLDNRVKKGKSYLVPATEDGWFRVTGPPGHDIVYWLVAPTAASPEVPALPAPEEPRREMTPRCNDELFQARGECVDLGGGPKQTRDAALPPNLSALGLKPRDLYFIRKDKTTVVSSPAPLNGPALYEFHVAHK